LAARRGPMFAYSQNQFAEVLKSPSRSKEGREERAQLYREGAYTTQKTFNREKDTAVCKLLRSGPLRKKATIGPWRINRAGEILTEKSNNFSHREPTMKVSKDHEPRREDRRLTPLSWLYGDARKNKELNKYIRERDLQKERKERRQSRAGSKNGTGSRQKAWKPAA